MKKNVFFRKDINGLRALAVLSVIFFHADFDGFIKGGFVGVDIFFVISGYLITTFIFNDLLMNKFSLKIFYVKRFKRLVPALFFIATIFIPFAFLWMTPKELINFSYSLLASIFFVSNFFFWRQNDYFGGAIEEIPLLHTWSLAVEAQFYIFFPILLVILWRYNHNKILILIITFLIISFFLAEWGWRYQPNANFYLSPTRAWEFLTGSVLSLILIKYKIKTNNYFSIFGLFLILFSIFFIDNNLPFPSYYTLLPVIGTSLVIIYSNDTQTFIGRFLSLRFISLIGFISYSAYLWHQPLFVFAKIRFPLEMELGVYKIFIITLTLFFSFLTWKFIEIPFRRKINTIYLFKLAFIFLFLIISIHSANIFSKGFANRFEKEFITNIVKASERDEKFKKCHIASAKIPDHPLKYCKNYFINGNASTLIIGDSHLDSIRNELQEKLYELNISSYAVSYISCLPFEGFYRLYSSKNYKCNDFSRSVIEYAKKNKIKNIIIIARFPLYINGQRFNNQLGGRENGKPIYFDIFELKNQNLLNFNKKNYIQFNNERIDRIKDSLANKIKKMSQEFNIIIFEPIPEVGWHVPNFIIRNKLFYNIESKKLSHNYEIYKKRIKNFELIMKKSKNENLFIFPSSSAFCDKKTNQCLASDERGIFYRDSNHLSPTGAKVLVKKFIDNLPKNFLHE